MPARIFCKVGPLKGVSAEIQGEATLGRSRVATIRIQAELVSGEHIRIHRPEGESHYILEDLGSTNGTALDGIRVRGPERLGHLHVITLADEYDLIFQDQDRCSRRHEELAAQAGRRFELDGVPHEHTAIDENPPLLPSFQDGSPRSTPRSAKEPSSPKSPPAKPAAGPKREPRDETRIDQAAPVLPSAIAGLAGGAETGPTGRTGDGTQIQQAPLTLPGPLANKVEELQEGEAPGIQPPRGKPPTDKSSTDKPPADKPTVKLRPIRGPQKTVEAETVTEEGLERLMMERDFDELGAGGGDGEAGDVPAFAVAVAWPESDIQYHPLREGDNVVGRGEGCEVRIESSDVSRRHAVIVVVGSEITVRDIGSSNHTFVEGIELEKNIPAALKHGSRVKFGGVRVRVMHWIGNKEKKT